jgi:hypothetical protein
VTPANLTSLQCIKHAILSLRIDRGFLLYRHCTHQYSNFASAPSRRCLSVGVTRTLVFSSGLCGAGEGGAGVGWGVREKITRMGLKQDVGAGGGLGMKMF